MSRPAPPPYRPRTCRWIIGGIALLAVGVAGCAAPAPSATGTTTTTAAPTTPAAATTTAAPVQVVLPEVAGRNGQIVLDELAELGLTNVTTSSADPNATVVLLPANWTVTKIEPAVGTTVESDDTVVVTMTKSR